MAESAALQAKICRNNKQGAVEQLFNKQTAHDTTRTNHEDVCCTNCKFAMNLCGVVFSAWIRYMGMPNPGSVTVNVTKC